MCNCSMMSGAAGSAQGASSSGGASSPSSQAAAAQNSVQNSANNAVSSMGMGADSMGMGSGGMAPGSGPIGTGSGADDKSGMAGANTSLSSQISQMAQNGQQPTEAQAAQALADNRKQIDSMITNPNISSADAAQLSQILGHIDVMDDMGMTKVNDLAHENNLLQQYNAGGETALNIPMYKPVDVTDTLKDLSYGNSPA